MLRKMEEDFLFFAGSATGRRNLWWGLQLGGVQSLEGKVYLGHKKWGGGGHAYEDVSRTPDYEVGRGFWCGSA